MDQGGNSTMTNKLEIVLFWDNIMELNSDTHDITRFYHNHKKLGRPEV